jgi:cytosine/adenosine deaminase-related metal-dependent hydrolase
VVQDDDEILADSQRLVEQHHDRSPGALTRIALAPCSPFSVSTSLMSRTAELAERLDVRLHTHLAETQDEEAFCLETFGRRPVDYLTDVGWLSDRVWLAHVVWPSADEIRRLGAARVGAAHCPSSNMILGSGLAPVLELRATGAPVGLGVDGSASADSASLWLEARTALLQGKLRSGAGAMGARDALEMATRGGAACLGRAGEIGELSVGACGDVAVWDLTGPAFAGALSDPIEAWLRCGPVAARHTVVGGRLVVEDGVPVHPALDEQLAVHRRVSARIQAH